MAKEREADAKGWIALPAKLVERLQQIGMVPYLTRVTGIPEGTLYRWRYHRGAWAEGVTVKRILEAIAAFDNQEPPEIELPSDNASRADAAFREGCRALHISPDVIKTSGRICSHLRWRLMKYLRDRDFSLPTIARAVGLKNHTSVMHALRQMARAGMEKAAPALAERKTANP